MTEKAYKKIYKRKPISRKVIKRIKKYDYFWSNVSKNMCGKMKTKKHG